MVLGNSRGDAESTSRSNRFTVCWWNGGGGLLKRLKVNPVLKDIFHKLPDMFVSGESELSKSSGLF